MSFGDEIRRADRTSQQILGGVPVIYRPVVGPPVSLTPDGDPLIGIFDENYFVSDGTFNGVEADGPSIVLRLEDLPTDPRCEDPKLTILGKDYFVRLHEHDGTIGGSIRLVLRLDNP